MRVHEPRVPELPVDVAAAVEAARLRGEAALEEARLRTEAVLDEARVRGEAAWDALRGEKIGPPLGARRWPVAVGAAVVEAVAAAAVAMLLQRLRTQDPPGAQEPEELEAVVDRAD